MLNRFGLFIALAVHLVIDGGRFGVFVDEYDRRGQQSVADRVERDLLAAGGRFRATAALLFCFGRLSAN